MQSMNAKGLYPADQKDTDPLRRDFYPYSMGLQKIPMYKTFPTEPGDWQGMLFASLIYYFILSLFFLVLYMYILSLNSIILGVYPHDRLLHGMKYFAVSPISLLLFYF